MRGAPDAIAFYQQVFGATVRLRLDAPDGSVMHAELAVGGAAFMLSEEQPQWNSLSPLAIGGSASSTLVYVPDVDAVVERAVAAGAKVTMPVADQFWGDRSGHIVDPFGHQWFVSTRIEEPTPEELQRRIDAMFAQQGAGPAGS
ncbi:VOC family protein [Caldimonas thermodepolymerans]|uniref:VOC family protein n=1 Tax=Caldimonas thermodepolymerans TaxID=215580 RepID=UPI001F3C536D|nr:VOC family protein [Caldimonas thermodepolymerans]UZG50017.1 VOC family protein [Caldimonas thermodepolymerans]